MQTSRAVYDDRMHKVLAYIDAHLDSTLDLSELASLAHFSDFHFHRLFAAWTGERLGDYVRRRRLEVAAFKLASQPNTAVLNIALAVGFGSAEAFARAFKLRFGMTPSEWRLSRQAKFSPNSKIDQVLSNFDQATQNFSTHTVNLAKQWRDSGVQVKLEECDPVSIAYLRHIGPYGAPIAQFWRETVAPWLIANQLTQVTRFGITHDEPSITNEQLCRYDAAVACSEEQTLLGNAQRTRLAGGLYAVMPFEGNNAQIVQAWTALLRDWLPASGMQMDARPAFERYRPSAKFDPVTGIFDCDICIPVAPLF